MNFRYTPVTGGSSSVLRYGHQSSIMANVHHAGECLVNMTANYLWGRGLPDTLIRHVHKEPPAQIVPFLIIAALGLMAVRSNSLDDVLLSPADPGHHDPELLFVLQGPSRL
jgi:hypothetical protein